MYNLEMTAMFNIFHIMFNNENVTITAEGQHRHSVALEMLRQNTQVPNVSQSILFRKSRLHFQICLCVFNFCFIYKNIITLPCHGLCG